MPQPPNLLNTVSGPLGPGHGDHSPHPICVACRWSCNSKLDSGYGFTVGAVPLVVSRLFWAVFITFAQLINAFLIAVLLALFAVRPLVKRILTVDEPAQPALAGPDGMVAEGGGALTDQSGGALGTGGSGGIEIGEDGEPRIEWLEEAQAAGAVQVATIAKVGDLINEYPNEAVGIIRGWMNEAA